MPATAIFSTVGNEDCHIILRGGKAPNYDASGVAAASEQLESAGLVPRLMIDFSHGNSSKEFLRQLDVGDDVSSQIASGDERIMGAMIESHLREGRQDCEAGAATALEYGKSITDACIGWEDTVPLLEKLAAAVRQRRSGATQASA